MNLEVKKKMNLNWFIGMIKTLLIDPSRLDEFIKDTYAMAGGAGLPRLIIGLMVGILVFASVIGTIAWYLSNASSNTSVAAIPGGTAMIGIIGLMVIVSVVLFIIKRV
jgi:hypothetical protein